MTFTTQRTTTSRVEPVFPPVTPKKAEGDVSDLLKFVSVSVMKEVSSRVVMKNGFLDTNESTYIKYAKEKVHYGFEFPQVNSRSNH